MKHTISLRPQTFEQVTEVAFLSHEKKDIDRMNDKFWGKILGFIYYI